MARKEPQPVDFSWVAAILAEKEGFEPSLRLSHTTPLAGEVIP